jgi:hypothetical protein
MVLVDLTYVEKTGSTILHGTLQAAGRPWMERALDEPRRRLDLSPAEAEEPPDVRTDAPRSPAILLDLASREQLAVGREPPLLAEDAGAERREQLVAALAQIRAVGFAVALASETAAVEDAPATILPDDTEDVLVAPREGDVGVGAVTPLGRTPKYFTNDKDVGERALHELVDA